MAVGSAIHYATSRDGTRIAWTAVGDGPSLIFAPPWPISLASPGPWPSILESRFDGRIVYYDRRGFGSSERDVEHTVERYTDDLEAVADAAGLDQIVVYSSVGSCCEALHLGARTPRVVKAVLGEPFLSGAEWHSRREIRPLLGLIDQSLATFWQVMAQYASGWGRPLDRFGNVGAPAAGEAAALANQHDLRATVDAYEACELGDIAPLVNADCLISHNTGDSLVPHPDSARLAQLLPNAHLLLYSAPERWSFPAEVTARVKEFLRGETAADGAPYEPGHLSGLSPREQEILALITAGTTNREIAENLVIAEATAARHVHNILGKLGLANRTEAAAWWAKHEREFGK